MAKGTIFISHREEYAPLVSDLKNLVADASGGKIKAFISQEIHHGKDWRKILEERLRDCDHLFLVYGAPYEDWSWCFYEAGYFSGHRPETSPKGETFCVLRPGVPPPGPLAHLQMITGAGALKEALSRIFDTNEVRYDAAKLLESIEGICPRLFGEIEEFHGYPRLYLAGKNKEFHDAKVIPGTAKLSGNPWVVQELFGIHRPSLTWSEITSTLLSAKLDGEKAATDRLFLHKWLDETSQIVLEAREGRIVAPQTILIARNGGKRCRLLLYQARTQADDVYCCEFLVINEVGGPTVGLSSDLLALLTGIRMGFRFKYEFVERFQNLFLAAVSREERKKVAQEIHRALSNLQTEADSRGNFVRQDFLSIFDDAERSRVTTVLGYWELLYPELYRSLGLSVTGENAAPDGLEGQNIERFQNTMKALRLLNTEFLCVCCGRLSKRMGLSPEQLEQTRHELDQMIHALAKTAAVDAA
jgi:hypothetical protein